MARPLQVRVAEARKRVALLEVEYEFAELRSVKATPGGIADYDPAILSGIRRRPNRKADTRRHNAYHREAVAAQDLAIARDTLTRLEHQLVQQQADEAARAELNLSEVQAGGAIRTRHGWHRVARVSAKSVTVATPYSWTERIRLEDILETRP